MNKEYKIRMTKDRRLKSEDHIFNFPSSSLKEGSAVDCGRKGVVLYLHPITSIKENFNSFSKYSYQANRKLGLPADNFFNN